MKRLYNILVLLILLVGMFPINVSAQEVPHVIRSTKPISTDLRGYLDAWLAVDAPSSVIYYIVTNTTEKAEGTRVSLVGVNLASPDEAWSFEDGAGAVWVGSVTVLSDGTVELQVLADHPSLKYAMPSKAAGGGSYVAFPFASGRSMQFGPRGVHGEGDYGTSGMLFVDLVSGDDMGASSAPPYIYASDAGIIDYVCDDGTSVAVRTFNEDTGDYFLYAHLLDNASLEEDTEFTRGQLIGSLKYGTFDPPGTDCGWAAQADNHYHVHWGFVPAAGKFQVGSCVLTVSTQKWACGDKTVSIGGWLTGGGGFSTPGDSSGQTGAGAPVEDPTFWDYLLVGVLSVVDRGIFKLLPEHNSFELFYVIMNVLTIMLKIVRVLVFQNISLYPLIVVFGIAFTFRAVMFVVWLIAALFKAWKSLVPVLGA